jgi:hypothetical protein
MDAGMIHLADAYIHTIHCRGPDFFSRLLEPWESFNGSDRIGRNIRAQQARPIVRSVTNEPWITINFNSIYASQPA